MAEVISRCGEDLEQVKKCLYQTRNYKGASWTFSFGERGDVIRQYGLLQVGNGRIEMAGLR